MLRGAPIGWDGVGVVTKAVLVAPGGVFEGIPADGHDGIA